MRPRRTLLVAVVLAACAVGAVHKEAVMGGSPSQVRDERFSSVRDVNTPVDVSYLSKRYKTVKDWKKRAAELREQILAGAGLLPMPEKTPLNARIFGRIDRGDYTVEKACFESYPGFYVAGNLYRPKTAGRHPGVLNPHGHWGNGRFENTEWCSVQGRCINFAKQGYVAFSYDMVGYNDSKQVDHRGNPFAGRRERLYGISLAGLQLWNSIRALDFLQTLPDVDKNRIACTGASGGGTQTFLLCAVDDRVKVAAPVNMISHTMQGGCRCENLPLSRIDTDNVEIGALMAPRPLLMVSATGDWTKETPDVEFPAIRSIYKLFGAEDKVECVRFDAPHNYNKDSREAVYSFFGKWLPKKPLPQPVKEQPFEVENTEDLLVFPGGKLPEGALRQEQIADQLMAASEKQLEANNPRGEHGLAWFRRVYQPVLRRALAVPESVEVAVETAGTQATSSGLVIHDRTRGASVRAVVFEPEGKWNGNVLIQVSAPGDRGCSPFDHITRRGWRVLAMNCSDVPSRDYDANFFDTYNRTDIQERVYDILMAASYLRGRGDVKHISLIGNGEAGLWCLLAAACIPGIDSVVVDACGIDPSANDALATDLYAPCLRRAGDFRTAMALASSGRLFIHNTRGKFDTSWAEAAFKAARKPNALRVERDIAANTEIARWLNGND